jgi:hypothetical protein
MVEYEGNGSTVKAVIDCVKNAPGHGDRVMCLKQRWSVRRKHGHRIAHAYAASAQSISEASAATEEVSI